MDNLKVSKETLVRTIVLIIALINSVIATLWAWWKNNSFTKEAIEADEYKKKIKEK